LSVIETVRLTGSLRAAAKTLGIGRTSLNHKIVAEVLAGDVEMPAPITVVEEHILQRKVKSLEARNKELTESIVADAAHNQSLELIAGTSLSPPEWLSHRPTGKTHHATITAFLSDTHFDEVVSATEMNGVNCYNRKIAELRLRKFFDMSVRLTRDYIAGVKIDGLVLPLGGDMVTGNIHDELERTNDAPILDTCLHWAEQIAAGIEMQLKFFPKIFVPCVVGNHGRLRKKPQHKNVARDNYDWLIYQMIAKHFRSDSRVQFMIPDGPDCYYDVYTTRNLLTHGNQFSGGNGIGGIAVPIMRGDAKKQKSSTAIGRSYDVMQIGHWHQRMDLGSVLINGSTKGYDEYALFHNFNFEPPQQSLWVTTPERGKTFSAPIFVMSDEEKRYWK
jgi:hypothetical protein